MDEADLEPMGEEMDPMMEDDMMEKMKEEMEKMDDEVDMSGNHSQLTEQDKSFDLALSAEVDYSFCFQFMLCMIAICVGLLQGYQVGIIAGTELFFGKEYKGINHAVDTDNDEPPSTQDREFFVSFFSLGAALGSFFGCLVADWIGRKWAAIIGNVFIAAGFIIIIVGNDMIAGFAGRFVSGIGQGIQSFAIPLYLNEVGTNRYNKIIEAFFTLSMGGGMILGLNLAIPFRN